MQGLQLHGHESPEYCSKITAELKKINQKVDIIKVFSIKEEFNFEILKPYEDVCDYYLFDTKGALPGGNGYVFDWKVLKNYPSNKPYFFNIHNILNLCGFNIRLWHINKFSLSPLN